MELQPDGQGKDGQTRGGLVEVGRGVWQLVFISRLRLIFIVLPLCLWISGAVVTRYFPGSYGRGNHEAVRVLLLTWAAGKGGDVPENPLNPPDSGE